MLKRIIALLMTVLMISMCVSCGEKQASTGDKVSIKWVMPGPGKQEDADKVMKAFNKKLQEYLPGVTLEVETFPWNEYAQKVLLMQTSGEKLDIVNTAPLDFGTEVRKGSFQDITQIVNDNCKELKELYVDYMWDYTSIDGKIYAVPSDQGICRTYGAYVPKELSDKYWDSEKAQQVFLANNTMTEECYDVIEEYLAGVKESGNMRKGMQESAQYAFKGYESFYGDFGVRLDDKKCEVVYLYETPEMKLYIEKMADWYKKGYIRKDALSSYQESSYIGDENGYILWLASAHKNAADTASKQYGFDIDEADFIKPYVGYNNANAGGNAIAASCKNPEIAVKLLNLVNSDKEMYRLLTYGIEGDHYEKINDDKAKLEYKGGNASSSDRYGIWGYAVGNTFLGFENEIHPEGWYDYLSNLPNNVDVKSNLVGFIPDSSTITSEAAQVSSIRQEYAPALISGVQPDYKAKYDEFMKKLEQAGIDKVKKELQKQVDAFLKSKK